VQDVPGAGGPQYSGDFRNTVRGFEEDLMRKFLASLTAATVVAAMSATPFAAMMTVKGKVVDEGCSMKTMDNKSAKEMDDCALMCAKAGEPLALLTADGKVYRIGGGLAANKNAKLIAHLGHTVEITGDVSDKDGKVVIAADALKMSK
jgi:hypothetical protein